MKKGETMKIPGTNKKEDQMDKQKKAQKELQASQDSFNISKSEAAFMQQRQEQQEQTRNQLLDPERDKQRLKQLLLNIQKVEKPVYIIQCSECGETYNNEIKTCSNCGSEKLNLKQNGTYTTEEKITDDSLMNKNGFYKVVWSEVEPAISSTVAGGYLRNSEVSKLNYTTLATITQQLALYPWRYGVDNPTDMQQIGDIIRPILIGHTSKARGGRGLESTEKTVMQKITQTLTGEEEEENDNIIF